MKIAKSVNRLGTEAVYNIFAKTKELEKQGKKIIDLSLGQSDFKSPKHAVDAAIQALKDGHHGYTLPNGIIECREAVSKKIKSLYKADINPARVVIMPGGKPTMFYAISFFGEPGAEIIYPDPGFPIYESMINFTGAKAVPYSMIENKDFSINPDKILSLVNEKTRLLILNGWSKTYAMTGWRLGWSVWPEKLIEHVFKFCVNSHSCVNTPAQYGAIAALEGSEDHLNNMMKEFNIRRKLIVEGLRSLKGIECSLPGGSFFVFPNVKGTGMNGEKFAEKCLNEAEVAMIPGTAFGKFATDNVRLNFATSRENISEAIEKIGKILK